MTANGGGPRLVPEGVARGSRREGPRPWRVVRLQLSGEVGGFLIPAGTGRWAGGLLRSLPQPRWAHGAEGPAASTPCPSPPAPVRAREAGGLASPFLRSREADEALIPEAP